MKSASVEQMNQLKQNFVKQIISMIFKLNWAFSGVSDKLHKKLQFAEPRTHLLWLFMRASIESDHLEKSTMFYYMLQILPLQSYAY